MAVAYTQIAEGDKYSFGTGVEAAVETQVEEGGMVEVKMTFSFRFSGFETLAVIYENNLRSQQQEGEYIQPWDGNYQLVYVDPDKPVWYVRYKKGIAWGVWLAASLIVLGVAWAAFSLWQLFKAIPSIIPSAPWLVPVIGVGLITVALLNAINNFRKSEVKTVYAGKLRLKEEQKY